MVAYQLVFLVTLSLLLGLASPQDLQTVLQKPYDIKCDSKQKLKASDCLRAIAKFKYTSSKELDRDAVEIQKAFGNCVVTMYNINRDPMNQAVLEGSFKKILDKCKDSAGSAPLPGSPDGNAYYQHRPLRFTTRPRGIHIIPVEEDYPNLKPLCFPSPKILSSDCQNAYNNIPINHQTGTFLWSNDYAYVAPLSESINKTCQATIYTTDGSTLTIKKGKTTDGLFKQLIDACKDKPGVIFTSGGAKGLNGRVGIYVQRPQHRQNKKQ
ncbi:hypothetical protein PGTUg99_012533 [Puccinia graminis f. sp. tritici]|uniref:Uncharacterized protein n=1 Tax=Puccinia graminis f. sp. tritici TaxID=56615 RepID=A0A5B0S702_PUCGR|nr:hypothetical protein PGTUg99_012533 [Puccinia graminis f. sp. tritici]